MRISQYFDGASFSFETYLIQRTEIEGDRDYDTNLFFVKVDVLLFKSISIIWKFHIIKSGKVGSKWNKEKETI